MQHMNKAGFLFVFLQVVSICLCKMNDRNLTVCPVNSIYDSSGTFCCPSSCGQCGGSGCDRRPGGARSCCTSQIFNSCDTSGAPCIASTATSSQCPTDSIADPSNQFCCPDSCGTCGGTRCNTRPGGASSCCTSQIRDSCISGIAPCVALPTSNSSCPTGGVPNVDGTFCCPSSCGQCGGNGCHTRPGGASDCCTSQISTSCTTGDLPCELTSSTSPPTTRSCPTGGILDANDEYCCPSSCGECGGNGCHTRTGGASSCCTSQISKSCDAGNLPCMISPEDPETPEPVQYCPQNGILDVAGRVCCPESCEECGGDGCETRPGGVNCCISQALIPCLDSSPPCLLFAESPSTTGYCMEDLEGTFGVAVGNTCIVPICCPSSCEICSTDYACDPNDECCAYGFFVSTYSDLGRRCTEKDPICIIPTYPDACDPNPCTNGASCSISYDIQNVCNQVPICDCSEIGNNVSGLLCETTCGLEETPCGHGNYVTLFGDDICCPTDEECLEIYGSLVTTDLYRSKSYCIPKDRPVSCTPDLCLNGGLCLQANSDAPKSVLPFTYCQCPDGFEGGFCEIVV